MKKAKLKETKQKNTKKKVQEQQETFGVKTAVVTIVAILVTFGAFYFLTDFLISKRTKPVEESNSNTNTNTNEISFINLLGQSSKEYYVFALTETKNQELYERYATFNNKKYYTVDMNDTMNKAYLSDKTNVKDSVKDITIKETTLFVVKEGKIEDYFEGHEDIVKYLQKNIVPNSNIKNNLK